MKRFLYCLAFIPCFNLAFIQSYLQNEDSSRYTRELSHFYDANVAVPLVKELINSGSTEIVVFQTERKFTYIKSEDSILTFICWKIDSLVMVRILTADKIYSPVAFEGKEIFNFLNKEESLVTEAEKNQLLFVPPTGNINAIFYFSTKASGYFELPDRNNSAPTTYRSEEAKEKIRHMWYDRVYQTLMSANFNFKILSNYNRYAESPILK